MTPVDRNQFEILGKTEVIHKPTGAHLSTYEYSDPDHACSTMTVNWGRAGDKLEFGEDYRREDVASVARDILRELARKAAERGVLTPPSSP
jgi:hypothetical protein